MVQHTGAMGAGVLPLRRLSMAQSGDPPRARRAAPAFPPPVRRGARRWWCSIHRRARQET
jgi:hypothetical protein